MKRYSKNPVVTPEMVKPSARGYRVRGAFNPGAVRHEDETLLLLRVAEDCPADTAEVAVPIVELTDSGGAPGVLRLRRDDPDVRLKDTRGVVYKGQDYLSTLSHIRIARSRDGLHFTVDEAPFLFPSNPQERYGVEDARVVRLDGDYYINYTCVSEDGWSTELARTDDFRHIERLGIIFDPEHKDVCLFPEKVNGLYAALHRPNNSGFGKPSIWYADSPDLLHWGNHRCIARPRNTIWEEMKIGGGAPSIKTPHGWLQIYHAKGHDQVYSLFALLLDLNEPWRVIRRGNVPLMTPETDSERNGFFGNVIFCNGIVQPDDDRLLLYYGASDETTCLCETTITDVLASLEAAGPA